MDEKEFDEFEAISFIRNEIEDSLKDKYIDDDILLVIDVMMDFFEQFDENEDFDDSIENIVEYVIKQLKKDPENQIEFSDVPQLVEAELKYEETLY